MPRGRLHLESSALANAVGRGLVALLGAAIAWYGLMTVLLAFKISPSTVDDISGYRTALRAFDSLATHELPPAHVDVTPAGFDSPKGRELKWPTNAFVATWIGFGFGDALLCLLGAALAWLAVAIFDGELDLGEMQRRMRGDDAPPRRSGAGSRVR